LINRFPLKSTVWNQRILINQHEFHYYLVEFESNKHQNYGRLQFCCTQDKYGIFLISIEIRQNLYFFLIYPFKQNFYFIFKFWEHMLMSDLISIYSLLLIIMWLFCALLQRGPLRSNLMGLSKFWRKLIIFCSRNTRISTRTADSVDIYFTG